MKHIAVEFFAALFIGCSVQAQTADSIRIDQINNTIGAGRGVTVIHHQEEFDPKRDAAQDIRSAMVQAQKEHKHILLDVGGQWCIWCCMLDTLYMKNPDLSDYLYRHYIVVKVNVSKENKNTEVLSRLSRSGRLSSSLRSGQERETFAFAGYIGAGTSGRIGCERT